MLTQLRLLQLLSPVLPVGAYCYSQGLEWTVKQGWIDSASGLEQWLTELIEGPLAQQDLPLLRKLFQACTEYDVQHFNKWSYAAVAFRDTAELRAEERARAKAYLRILEALPDDIDKRYRNGIKQTPFAAIAWASVCWGIDEMSLLNAYAYNWLDAYIINGVKIIPLGQSEGQAMLHSKLPELSLAVETSMSISDHMIGFSTPSVSMASCAHEVQYSRIYRS